MGVTEQPPLRVAFESERLSYSDLPVDLYNSGVNQLLAVAATRGHSLRHYRMADLYRHEGMARVRTSILALPDGWEGRRLDAWRALRKEGEETILLSDLDLHLVRGDDIRTEQTPNVDILREAEAGSLVLESVSATLSTCDKYAMVERAPHVPQPLTFTSADLEGARAAIKRLPTPDGWFVLKDRFGFGCGAQVHRLHVDTPNLEGILAGYLAAYGHVLIQEFRSEVADGDLVVTFLDDVMLGALKRVPAEGEWKTNASLGAAQVAHELDEEQERAARAARRAFPECRLASIDLLLSGRVMEINAFPGAAGLDEAYGIVLADRVLDVLEAEVRR